VDLWHLPDRFGCLGRSVGSFWSEPERVGARLAQLITAETPIQGELEARRQDGSTFLVRACLSLVRDMNGRPESILGTFEDISALRESEARERRQDHIRIAAYQIAIAALEGHSLRDLCRIVHGHIKDYVPARNFYIAAVDPATGLVGFPFFLDEADPAPPPQPRGKSLTDLVLDGGETLLLERSRILELQAEGRLKVGGTLPSQWLGVPL